MKHIRLVAWILFLCMLTACAQPALPDDPSANATNAPTVETVPPASDPGNELTEPTDDPVEPDLSWFPAVTEKMGYDDYFAEDRPYYYSSFWLVETDGVTKAYTLQQSEAGLQVCTLGKRILRCETAPLCALSAVMYASGEF